jgi:molecular chaperone DnaK
MTPSPDGRSDVSCDAPAPVEGRSVGIDLGTTNSLVAVVEPGGEPQILPNRENDPITPSVVSLPPRQAGKLELGSYLVGRPALNAARMNPRNTIRSVKRFMGLRYRDPRVAVAKEHVLYELAEDPGRDNALVR